MSTNIKHCPMCGQSINERQIALFSGMVDALFRVWRWCEERNRHVFDRKDIKHLLADDNQIARFGDWIYFGGLVYKPQGRGTYGLNMGRAREFFSGKLEIPTLVWKNPLTGELKHESLRYIDEIPNIGEFLDANKMYIPSYRDAVQTSIL